MKRLITLTLAILLVAMLSGCSLVDRLLHDADAPSDIPNPIVTITTKTGGVITLELYPDVAPNTVANFISLIESGFYNGTIFHRVIPGFMIQGGDPLGTGMGGPGYAIKGEFTSNGFKNELLHTRGVISMARSSDPNSAGSQFFIMHRDAEHLNEQYAAFGRVTSGIDVVDQIANMSTDALDKPLVLEPCTIDTITVDTKGYEYKVVKQDD